MSTGDGSTGPTPRPPLRRGLVAALIVLIVSAAIVVTAIVGLGPLGTSGPLPSASLIATSASPIAASGNPEGSPTESAAADWASLGDLPPIEALAQLSWPRA